MMAAQYQAAGRMQQVPPPQHGCSPAWRRGEFWGAGSLACAKITKITVVELRPMSQTLQPAPCSLRLPVRIPAPFFYFRSFP